jgi:monovalent cation/proton antiporter MnhG/PhaG subunit
MKTISIDALLALAVLVVWISAAGMLRMRDAYQRMHFMSPPASLTVFLITIAVFLQQGLKPESFKALFIVLILLAMNTVVTHATARAFRIREVAPWRSLPGQEVPIRADDELVMPGKAEEGS